MTFQLKIFDEIAAARTGDKTVENATKKVMRIMVDFHEAMQDETIRVLKARWNTY